MFFKISLKINEIHLHETRLSEKSIDFLPRVSKSFDQLSLPYRGVKF